MGVAGWSKEPPSPIPPPPSPTDRLLRHRRLPGHAGRRGRRASLPGARGGQADCRRGGGPLAQRAPQLRTARVCDARDWRTELGRCTRRARVPVANATFYLLLMGNTYVRIYYHILTHDAPP